MRTPCSAPAADQAAQHPIRRARSDEEQTREGGCALRPPLGGSRRGLGSRRTSGKRPFKRGELGPQLFGPCPHLAGSLPFASDDGFWSSADKALVPELCVAR